MTEAERWSAIIAFWRVELLRVPKSEWSGMAKYAANKLGLNHLGDEVNHATSY